MFVCMCMVCVVCVVCVCVLCVMCGVRAVKYVIVCVWCACVCGVVWCVWCEVCVCVCCVVVACKMCGWVTCWVDVLCVICIKGACYDVAHCHCRRLCGNTVISFGLSTSFYPQREHPELSREEPRRMAFVPARLRDADAESSTIALIKAVGAHL